MANEAERTERPLGDWLRELAAWLREAPFPLDGPDFAGDVDEAAAFADRLHARVAELEAALKNGDGR